jgi:hypothetical protein
VICSDQVEHRRRVESRTAEIPGFRLPTWDEVVNRDWDPWDSSARIVIDSGGQTPAQSSAALEHALASRS